MEVPLEVLERVGKALTPEKLDLWWNRANPQFGNLCPAEMWLIGGEEREKLLNHIQSAKSGDMA